MDIRKLAGICLIILLIAGCANRLVIQPFPTGTQKNHRISEFNVLESTKISSVLVMPVFPIIKSDQRLLFVVSVYNMTFSDFVFSAENIRAMVDGKKLKVFTYDEVIKEVNNELTARINSKRKAANASSTVYKIAEFISAVSHGPNYYNTITKPAFRRLTANSMARANADIKRLQAIKEFTLTELKNILLQKQMILPGARHTGAVVIEGFNIEAFNKVLHMQLTTGNENHNIKYLLKM